MGGEDLKIGEIPARVADIVYPRRCPVCDDAVDSIGRYICRSCEAAFEAVSEPYCLKCGKPLLDDSEKLCRGCEGGRHTFDRGRAAFKYDTYLKESIYRYKYGGRREYADYYVFRMTDILGGFIKSLSPDALIPIPLHKSRLKERGYNQAELIAQGLGKKLEIPVKCDVLIRSSKTEVQKSLNAAERQNNLKKALKISSDVVKLKNVVLIDDIYTTGSTMDAAASCLKEAGVLRVFFAVLGVADKY